MAYGDWKTGEPIDWRDEAPSPEEQLQADYEDWVATLDALDEADIEALAARDAYHREAA